MLIMIDSLELVVITTMPICLDVGRARRIQGVGPWLVVRGSSSLQACYASFSWWRDGRPRPSPLIPVMPYRVVSFTMAQVRQGALGFQRELSALLGERPEIKVYSVSPFDLDERRRFKDRFGGDIVYFLNDAACQECERLNLNLQFLGELSDDEMPRRRTVVVGVPERTGGTPTV